MAEEKQYQAPYEVTSDTGATLVSIFRQRLWEKENLDFKAGVIKQAQTRIQQAGAAAANATVDSDPNGDIVANVPKEMIMTAHDVKMAATQYPNNPLINKTANEFYNISMSSVKELMGFDKQKSDIDKQGADTQYVQSQADTAQADLAAGKPSADVEHTKAQTSLLNRTDPNAGSGSDKPQMVYGVPRGTVLPSAGALYSQIRLWEKTPAGSGGPDQDAWNKAVDSRREEMAARRWQGMVGQPKNSMPDAEKWTLKDLAQQIPYEDAKNEARFEEMLTAAPMLGVSAQEVQDKFGFLTQPGAASAAMTGKPGRPLQEPTIAAMTLGKNKLSDLETSKGKIVQSVKDAIEVLPDDYKQMTSGDGLVNASLSEGVEFLRQESNSEALAQLRSAPVGTKKKEVVRILKAAADRQIDDLFVEARNLSDEEIPEATAKNREKARRIAYAAIEKYQEQIMLDLGLIAPPAAPKERKGTSIISGETIDRLGKIVEEGPTGGLIRAGKKFVFGRTEIK